MGAVGLLALAAGRPPGGGCRRWPRRCVAGLRRRPALWPPTPASRCPCWPPAACVLLAPRWRDALRAAGVPPGWPRRWRCRPRRRWPAAPVVAALSGAVSLVAVPANLLAVPAVAPATLLGVGAAVVSSTVAGRRRSSSPGWPPGRPGGWCAIAHVGAGVPAGALPWPAGVVGGLLLAARHRGGAGRGPPAGRCAGSSLVAVARPWRSGALPVRLARPGLAAGRRCGGRLRRRPGRRARAARRRRARRWWSTPAPTRRGRRLPAPARRAVGAAAGASPTSTPTTSAAWPACSAAVGSARWSSRTFDEPAAGERAVREAAAGAAPVDRGRSRAGRSRRAGWRSARARAGAAAHRHPVGPEQQLPGAARGEPGRVDPARRRRRDRGAARAAGRGRTRPGCGPTC